MNEIAEYEDKSIASRPNSIMNKEHFQQIAEIAHIMASTSLIPESLSHSGSGDKKTLLPYETVRANCFLVANQAISWGMDPFAVAQCCSVVHGRLMFEGKLVSAVIESKLKLKLVHSYGKWDDKRECCILGEEASGDQLAIRIGEGRYNVDGIAIFTGRYVDGYVGGWKTTGNNSPWRPSRNRSMLIYRGAREWARAHEPGVMLGVIADDEYDPAYGARDITPAPSSNTERAGGSIIDRLKANQTQPTGGFDHSRVEQDLNSADPHTPAEEGASLPLMETQASEAGEAGRCASPASDDQNGGSPSSQDDAAGEAAPEKGTDAASPLSTDEQQQWLQNIGVMLWSATNYNGEISILEAQRKAAATAYPPDGITKPFLDKATAVFKRCSTVVKGEIEPSDGLEIVAGLIGLDAKELTARSKRG